MSRGLQVPRQPSLAITARCRRAGGGASVLAGAEAQRPGKRSGRRSFSMRPALDGDPRNPPRFRRRASGTGHRRASANSRVSTIGRPRVPEPPASIPAMCRKRKGKPGQPAKPGKARPMPGSKPKAAATADRRRHAEQAHDCRQRQDRCHSEGRRRTARPSAVLAQATAAGDRAACPAASATRSVRARRPRSATLSPPPLPRPPPSLRPPPEEKPFDPLGIQVGAFNFRPAVEYIARLRQQRPRATRAAADRQLLVQRLCAGAAGQFELVAPRAHRQPARQLHQPTIPLTDSTARASTPRSMARIDVTSHTPHRSRRAAICCAPTTPAARTSRPISRACRSPRRYGGTAGLGQRFNRFEVTLKGGCRPHRRTSDSELHRRADRQQRRPQLQPVRHPRCAPATR